MTEQAQVSVLELRLHNTTIGYLTGYRDGLNLLTFNPEYRATPDRPTLSLTTHPDFPKSDALMAQPWVRRQRLHPVLSNLLPEGALRTLLAQALKTHPDNEFELFTWLGQDLPGALVANPLEPDAIPSYLLDSTIKTGAIKPILQNAQNRFSLAGVQMKFSMQERDGRYRIAKTGALGDWIIKTPSTTHKHVPLNEYTAMRLAQLVDIDIPDIRLVAMSQVEQLPQINLPDEDYAFAIRRFDRHQGTRIHMEDFAQVLAKYPHEKYQGGNYQQLARILYHYSKDGLKDVQQLARRLLVNLLLANGDAHLKNWSLIYPDRITPELSPAYDIVTTRAYIQNEQEFALNLGKTKACYRINMQEFQYWAEKSDIPWRAIRPHLLDVLDKARTLWPEALHQLPMADDQKSGLQEHWSQLQPDFQINV